MSKQHRITVTVDLEGDAYRAGRVREAMDNAAARLNAELQDSTVERLDQDEPNAFRPELDCWCGRPAQACQPTVPYDDGTYQPVCIEHAQDGFVHLDDLSDVELGDKLGL